MPHRHEFHGSRITASPHTPYAAREGTPVSAYPTDGQEGSDMWLQYGRTRCRVTTSGTSGEVGWDCYGSMNLKVLVCVNTKLGSEVMTTRMAKGEGARSANVKTLPFRYQFSAGAIAGISEVSNACLEKYIEPLANDMPDIGYVSHGLLVRHVADGEHRYPLDVVKTRIQLQHGKSTGTEGYDGVLDCFRKILRQEGVSRLYRGITAPILMEVPKRSAVPHDAFAFS
jgi:hypothetical protein